jgi:hypothetical protein
MRADKRTAWLTLAMLAGLAISAVPLASGQNFTDGLGIFSQFSGFLPASRNEVQGDLVATQGQEDAKVALLENTVKVLTAKLNSLTPVHTVASLAPVFRIQQCCLKWELYAGTKWERRHSWHTRWASMHLCVGICLTLLSSPDVMLMPGVGLVCCRGPRQVEPYF